MSQSTCPDVTVYVCCNCIPQGRRLPRQWRQQDAQVLVQEVPCSGKIDAQYLLHAFEGAARGICVVACPHGDCHLSQGNYRAEVRVRMVKRMLGEVGLEPERAELLFSSAEEPFERFEQLVRDAVSRVCACGETPLTIKR